ncbi:MAG: ATP-binding protein [Lentisphaeria bacterium]|nr:ATP-binding protein [Lentisphaeria bacterium]
MPKDLTCSTYTFEILRKGNFLYVDKTEYIWKLLQPSSAMYFLARPRRFGKSLTLSTLKAVFQGKKELFKGLAIYDKPYDWKVYPVIHISMSGWLLTPFENYEESLRNIVLEQAKENGVVLEKEAAPTMFRKLLAALTEGGTQAVVLIDEYDKPLMDNVGAPDIQRYLSLLKGFYSVLKDRERDIRFAFVTGVTKVCHVSLFSDLNNLRDISMDAAFATMLGYTQQEFEENFAEWIAETEPQQTLPHEHFLPEIKNWYDGFRFHPKAESVYNPVSLASFFQNGGEFRNYWFTTGTPTALFRMMQQQSLNLPLALEESVPMDFFEAFEINRIDAKTLMYQTGYLTIVGSENYSASETSVPLVSYRLGFPNYEVRHSFNSHLLNYYANLTFGDSFQILERLAKAVRSGDVAGFVEELKRLFAGIPYAMRGKPDAEYQPTAYVVFMMLNSYVSGEHRTSSGRIDLVLTAAEWTYVIEFKINKTAKEAMKQIQNKDYARQFLGRGQRVVAVGINFDTRKRQISSWLHEEMTD